MSNNKITPEQIHEAEQRWATAQGLLSGLLDAMRHDVPIVEQISGMSDMSALYDYAMFMLIKFEKDRPGRSIPLCAAALVRLIQLAAPAPGDDLVHFEKDMENPE